MRALACVALVLCLVVVACHATTDLRMKRVGGRASALKDVPDDEMNLPRDACPVGSSCCKATDGSLMKCPHRGGSCCAGDSSCCPMNHDCVKDATGASRCKKNANAQFRELGLAAPPAPAGGAAPRPKPGMSLQSTGAAPKPPSQATQTKQAVNAEKKALKQEEQAVAVEKEKLRQIKKIEKKEERKIANAEAKADEKKIAKAAGGSDRGNLQVKARMSNTGAGSNAKLNNGATVGGEGTKVSTSTMDIINHVIVDLHQSGPPENPDDESSSSSSSSSSSDSGGDSGSSSS